MLFYGGWFDVGYGLVLIGLVVSLWASWNVKSTFRRYQNDHNSRGLTAAQVARQILDDNGLYQIRIERVSGNLTDHYDPKGNVIRLSDSVHDSTSVAAIGVAAHECGHAVQHSVDYFPMQVRSAIIPVTQIGSRLWYIVFLLGMIFSNSYAGMPLQMAGILLFSLIVFFQLATLPVEFNASSRAMQTLESRYILSGEELTKARKVLTAAALTYVAALLNSILQLSRAAEHFKEEQPKMSARKLAVQLLNRTEQEQSYSNLLLDSALSQSQLDDRDKRLCASLYYGVIERRITLDAVISHYSKQPLRKLDCTVRNILRLGIYQLLYCDQIPSRAAVNESVKLTKTCRKASASGFVNAVLCGFLRDECKVPYPKGKKAAMAVEYAVPQWLLEKLLDAYGEETTRAFLADALQPANRFIRQNPAACTGAELEQALGDAVSPTNLPGAYELHTGDIRKLPEFRKGWFYVQDLSSQICALALGAKPGETILDLCAAPGGKTCTIAAGMAQSGMVYAFDLAAHRVKLIQDNVKRLGLQNVTASQGDAAEFREEYAGADRVLCDVPCSGIGVLRHKPEVKEKSPEDLAQLPQLQLAILENGARYVKPDGILQYSTCTILKEENENVAKAFLQKHPEFVPEPVYPELGGALAEPMVTILPEMFGSDGFFVAKFRRKHS